MKIVCFAENYYLKIYAFKVIKNRKTNKNSYEEIKKPFTKCFENVSS